MSLLAGQVHSLSATTPKWKLASRPGAAPGKLSFGDSAARAGARPKREIGAAAGSCTRTSSVAGRHSAVKSQPQESKRAGSVLYHTPGPRHFNKEQTPLAILRYQPTVSRWFFRCLGAHLLRSPSNVKSGLIHPARLLATRGQTPPAENLGSPAPFYALCQATSSRCRRCFVSQCSAFRYRVHFLFRFCMGKQKTLLPFR